MLQGQLTNRVEIQPVGLGINAVVKGLEPFATEIDRRSMGEMAAMGKVHAQDRVAGLEQGQKYRKVGLGSTVGLDVGPSRTKQLTGTVDGQGLNTIDVLTAPVIALARQTFGIFIGEHRALGFHDGPGGEILAGDQLKMTLLPIQLSGDQVGNGRIAAGQGIVDRGSDHGNEVRSADGQCDQGAESGSRRADPLPDAYQDRRRLTREGEWNQHGAEQKKIAPEGDHQEQRAWRDSNSRPSDP